MIERSSYLLNIKFISLKYRVPVCPYSQLIPNNINPEAKDPYKTYLIDASFEYLSLKLSLKDLNQLMLFDEN